MAVVMKRFRVLWVRRNPDPRLLESIAQIVRRGPNPRIQVSGHTDSSGVAATNKSLFEARARSVVTWFVGGGVAPARLEAVGFGDTRPVAPIDSAWNMGRYRPCVDRHRHAFRSPPSMP
jgi:outer membrane protein OmpA-like peptidoglycan-associated protein